MLKAEGARTSAILRAEGESKAIETVFQAIHDGAPDQQLLSYQYLQMLPQLAAGRGEQDLRHPERVHAGARELGSAPRPVRRAPTTSRGRSRSPGRAASATRSTRRPRPTPPPRPPRAELATAEAEGAATYSPPAVGLEAAGEIGGLPGEPPPPDGPEPPSASPLPPPPRGRPSGTARRPTLQASVRLPLREASGDPRRRPRPRRADRGGHRRARCARSAWRCSRPTSTSRSSSSSRRRSRSAALGAEVSEAAQPRPAGRQDRQRGADRADGRRARPDLSFSPRPPTVILMAGLQGSGKTTATAQARALPATRSTARRSRVAACDVYRPAAVEQLVKVGAQVGATVYEQRHRRATRSRSPRWALRPGRARRQGRADRRHRRPPARRRGADGRARRDPHGGAAAPTSCSSSTR